MNLPSDAYRRKCFVPRVNCHSDFRKKRNYLSQPNARSYLTLVSFFESIRGGPLLSSSGELLGIASGGISEKFILRDGSQCALSVFTRVSTYSDWINDTICGLSSNPPGCATTYDFSPESSWIAPCGPANQSCRNWRGQSGVRMSKKFSVFFFKFCWERCIRSTRTADHLLHKRWACGGKCSGRFSNEVDKRDDQKSMSFEN